MVRRAPFLVVPALLAVLVGVLAFPGERASALPPDFEDRQVTLVEKPTALAFAPDGRMLVATQPGQLRVYRDGALLATPALDLSPALCSNSERGLLGLALSPQFSTNGHVFVYYTRRVGASCDTANPDARDDVNRVSRFTMTGDTVDRASETVLIDNIPSPAGNHNAGDLHFGKDGNLYVSVGDGGTDYRGDSGGAGANDAARDTNVLLGKILRITPDGGIPQGNPFVGANSARCNTAGRTTATHCRETFATGLRNPFRMAFDPDATGTRFFVNDVGQNAWEEIDEGRSGADYAWNLCEGRHDNPSRSGSVNCLAAPYTPPIHEYPHTSGCSSITGAAFVPDAAGWPTQHNDSYLYGDYVCGRIFELKPAAGGGYAATEFAAGLGVGGPVAMAFGPFGGGRALYYTTYAGGDGGQVRRISYVGGGNRSPFADLEADRTFGAAAPLTVGFDGSGSTDADGDTLTHEWDFTSDGTTDATGLTATHTYAERGTYRARLTVRDPNGGSDSATVEVQVGNTPPQPSISSPGSSSAFRVGQRLTLTGSATDAEGNPVTLRWEVRRHHNADHFHPYFSGTGNNLSFTAPPPEDLSATGAGNYLEVRLTATDSRGLSRTVTRQVQPRRVALRFATLPTGLLLKVNGRVVRAPHALVSWEGYALNVSAPARQRSGGRVWVFDRWTDGRQKATRTIITPANARIFAADYDRPRRR